MKTAIERQRRLIEILCDRRYDLAENLAVEFGVSVRTIYRDIEVLASTYPIYTTQGTGGGIYVVDGFNLRMKYLTDRQYEILDKLSKRLSGEEKLVVLEILKIYKKPQGGRIAKKKNT